MDTVGPENWLLSLYLSVSLLVVLGQRYETVLPDRAGIEMPGGGG